MAVRKIRNSWWVDFCFNARRYRKRSPENSRAGAQVYETTLRRKLAHGDSLESPPPAEVPTFGDFAKTWFEEYVVPNNKITEQRNRKIILDRALVPFFGSLRITSISSRLIEQYKVKKIKDGIKNKTIKNHLSLLNRCLATAYEWLELPGAPPKIKWPKCDPVEMDYLSFDESELLLSNAEGIDYEVVLLTLRTGMRQGEIKALQWPCINWETRTIAVRHSRDDRTGALIPPKNNRIRHIPLDVDVYELLYRRKQQTGYIFLDGEGRPFQHKGLSRRLKRLCEAAGLRKIGWHALRHTFASHLAMKGVPITLVKELMGHADITTTMRYSHVAPPSLRAAIDALNRNSIIDGSWQQTVNRPILRQQPAISAEPIGTKRLVSEPKNLHQHL
jgi:integrase